MQSLVYYLKMLAIFYKNGYPCGAESLNLLSESAEYLKNKKGVSFEVSFKNSNAYS
jgi:hypothetical protein